MPRKCRSRAHALRSACSSRRAWRLPRLRRPARPIRRRVCRRTSQPIAIGSSNHRRESQRPDASAADLNRCYLIRVAGQRGHLCRPSGDLSGDKALLHLKRQPGLPYPRGAEHRHHSRSRIADDAAHLRQTKLVEPQGGLTSVRSGSPSGRPSRPASAPTRPGD